jgi:hypothetical protein
MSGEAKESDKGRSHSSTLKALNNILHGSSDDKNRSGSTAKLLEKKKKLTDTKLNSSTDQSINGRQGERGSFRTNNTITVTKNILSTATPGEKPAKESGSGLSSTHGKMSNQLTQLKSMLVGMKGNMADTKKKPTEGSTGAKPSTSTSKSRNNLLVNSSSAGKMNSSLDHGRIGQKSIEPKRPGKLGTGDGVNDFLHRTLAHLLPW